MKTPERLQGNAFNEWQKLQFRVQTYQKRGSLGASGKIVEFAKMIGVSALADAEILPYYDYFLRMSAARDAAELEMNLSYNRPKID